jgi:hypothetical protein
MTNLNVPGLGSFADVAAYVHSVGVAARGAARELARADTAAKNTALMAMAAAIRRDAAKLIAANNDDVAAAKAAGHDPAFVDRLTLSPKTIAAMAEGLEQIAALADPVGEITDLKYRPSGIQVGNDAGAAGCRRHHLRIPAERDRRRGSVMSQIGQCDHPARRFGSDPQQSCDRRVRA